MIKLISYYRVSTTKQKRSGLGLLAQKQIVQHYVNSHDVEIVGEYTETESAKYYNEREQLSKAIKECKENGYTLIVAKLDRLSRDVEHTFQIQKKLGENRLICCDLPNTDSLTLSIFAGLAQREREIISLRTKQAMQELKKKGVKLGNPQNFTADIRALGPISNKKKALENPNNKRATPLIMEYREKGYSFNKIALTLNESGFLSSKGSEFKKTTVKRLYDRNCIK